jgi:phage gp36-like protein
MSSYATAAQVKSYYGSLNFAQLTADSGSAPNDSAILAACTDQSSVIDGYLMGRYATPITAPANVVSVLSVHCCRLAVYALFQGRLMADQYTSVTTDRDITIAWLKDISQEKTSLPGQSEPVTPSTDTRSAVGGSTRQVFGDGELLGIWGNIDRIDLP